MPPRADSSVLARLGREHRVAVIAGGGDLPGEVVRSLTDAGHRPYVIVIGGQGQAGLGHTDHIVLEIEELGRLVSVLRTAGATHVVMAGSVTRRPNLRAVRVSFGVIKALPRMLAALARGDDGLLRAVVGHLEAEGFRVVGSHEIAPDILAPAGELTRTRPTAADRRSIDAALAAAKAIGALDIGQAAVAVGIRVVALEGVEGTAAMLERVRDLRAAGRIGMSGGVLVKCAKPDQELRADLPTIGPDTVAEAHAAGLSGIAIEAGRSIVLDRMEVAARADRHGLFVVGIRDTAS
jgi:DUF1009 family protein